MTKRKFGKPESLVRLVRKAPAKKFDMEEDYFSDDEIEYTDESGKEEEDTIENQIFADTAAAADDDDANAADDDEEEEENDPNNFEYQLDFQENQKEEELQMKPTHPIKNNTEISNQKNVNKVKSLSPSKVSDGIDLSLNSETIECDIPISLCHDKRLLRNWSSIWSALSSLGWKWQRGKGIIDFYYLRPGKKVSPTQPTTDIFLSKPEEDPDYFVSTEDVIEYIKYCIRRYELSIKKDSEDYVSSENKVLSKDHEKVLNQHAFREDNLEEDQENFDWLDEAAEILNAKLETYKMIDDFKEIDDPSNGSEVVAILEDIPVSLCVFVDAAEIFFDHLVILNQISIY